VVIKKRPDFLIRLRNGITLALEVKGQDGQQGITKRELLEEWVKALNHDGSFGQWEWAEMGMGSWGQTCTID
jgi:type III restriction enzyme